ncbi:MAG: hypothetical protein ACOC2B_02875 [Sediminispirochaetaceae bacterium]
MELSDRQMIGLYLFLQKREEELDDTLFSLYTKMQKIFREELSIEEMETLDYLYENKVDIFHRKG